MPEGIGISAGEHMLGRQGYKPGIEEWPRSTYGEVVMDAEVWADGLPIADR